MKLTKIDECDTANDVTNSIWWVAKGKARNYIKVFSKGWNILAWIMSGGPFLEADEHLELQGFIDDTMSGWDSCVLVEYVN